MDYWQAIKDRLIAERSKSQSLTRFVRTDVGITVMRIEPKNMRIEQLWPTRMRIEP